MQKPVYIAIDLKSFYASVECVDRHLDALTTNLVVADPTRTEKTIVLAVSPSLKAHGIPGRPRLFEVIQAVRELNALRRRRAHRHAFVRRSFNALELNAHPELELDYILAPPRMARYLEVSSQIYGIYLKYVSPEDIHVYSIDEVFINATQYLKMYGLSAHDFTMKLIQDVLRTTGITATAGIGPNLYLSKITMDIIAKHIPADADGVRIAECDELSYRKQLWNHRPLTDFWRIGSGYSRKLETHGMFTMGDVARMSIVNEGLLYRLFGVNAELLIDHAWGWEPCTIAEIKAYRPESSSLSCGQVLQRPYPFDQARLVVKEMTDQLALDLVEKRLLTNQLVLSIGYDVENLRSPSVSYNGAIHIDHYGRFVPEGSHGSVNLTEPTSSSCVITQAMAALFDRIAERQLTVRRLCVVANNLSDEDARPSSVPVQLELFIDYEKLEKEERLRQARLERERRGQRAMLDIRRRMGKNAIFRAMSLEEGATMRERNQQIGGHKA